MRWVLLGIMAVFCIFSCTDIDQIDLEIGKDLVSSNTKVYYIDTLSVRSSTIRLDSMAVNSSSRFVVGNYEDPIFGTSVAETFLQLRLETFSIDSEATYDSIQLVLDYDGYFYNDTLAEQRLQVFELLEEIEFNDDDGLPYNTTSFKASSQDLADYVYKPRPKSGDTLFINLDDAFGARLFEQIQEKDITDNEELQRAFKGLKIQAENPGETLVGFEQSSFVRLYYSIDKETDDDERVQDFTFGTPQSFTAFPSDFTGSLFEGLNSQEKTLSSLEADGQSFMQTGNGLLTKIDVPYLERIYDIPGTGTILSATLVVPMSSDADPDRHPIRDSIQAYYLDQKSDIVGTLGYGSVPVYGFLTEKEDTEFAKDEYRMDIKPFLNYKLDDRVYKELFLGLFPSQLNGALDRYILNDENQENDRKLKIELIYTIYDE